MSNPRPILDFIDLPILECLIGPPLAVGSQVTCNPPPPIDKSDYDFLCLTPDLRRLMGVLEDCDWDYEGGESYNKDDFGADSSPFRSYTKFVYPSASDEDYGVTINLIITADRAFYDKFVKASDMAKEQNLLKREDRVALFKRVLYGTKADLIPGHGLGKRGTGYNKDHQPSTPFPGESRDPRI